MSRASEFRDSVKSAWASQPEFTCRCGLVKATAQHGGGLIIPSHSKQLNDAADKCIAEFGEWLVFTFGKVEVPE